MKILQIIRAIYPVKVMNRIMQALIVVAIILIGVALCGSLN